MKYFIAKKIKVSKEVRQQLERFHSYEMRQLDKDVNWVVLLSDESFETHCDDNSPSPEEEIERKDILDIVKKLVETQLTAQEKAVIVHIFYEGHSQVETAKIMGITQQTVNDYLNRAYRKLKKKLLNYDI